MNAGVSSLPDIKGNDVNLSQGDTLSNSDNLLSSFPDIKGNDVNLSQDATLSNADNLPAQFDAGSGEESSIQTVGLDPCTSTGSDVSEEIDKVSSFFLPSEGNLGASAMSAHIENAESGFGHDGVDNLHGLSITRICHDQNLTANVECQENHEDGLTDIKAERINPFNSNISVQQNKVNTAHHTELMPKFLSLQSFEHDEVPANFIEDLSGLHLEENTEGLGEEILSNLNVRASSGFDMSNNTRLHYSSPDLSDLDHKIPPTVPPPPSDPWVKIPSGSPSMVEEPLASISPNVTPEKVMNVSPKVTPEKVMNDATKSKNALCLDGGLKKAPAIDPNTPLSLTVLDVPGPCEPEDLIEGIIFSANYLGTTQLISNRNPAKNARMFQAQEAVNRIKAPEGESQPTVEVDLFISTSKIKILNADTQETMMSHTLRSISYIADIGDLLVVMAKRLPSAEEQSPEEDEMMHKEQPKRHRIICHVLSSSDSHLIAESIGQCFNVAYQQFLQSNCIEPQNLTQADFNQLLDTQEMYHDDLVHYSNQENVKEIWVEKKKGETMGIAIVESGWGSIIPTVILANLQHGSPIERNGKFNIGDQIMAINGTSMVGLPLQTCHSIIKGLRSQTLVKINIVSCPPVVSVLVKRPNLKHQLGFSVQNGIICSLMRGGIAERGGVRVGHRIIEISNQSVVATPHDKIVQMLVTSVGEIQMKTMPAAMYRLLTGQEQPIYL